MAIFECRWISAVSSHIPAVGVSGRGSCPKYYDPNLAATWLGLHLQVAALVLPWIEASWSKRSKLPAQRRRVALWRTWPKSTVFLYEVYSLVTYAFARSLMPDWCQSCFQLYFAFQLLQTLLGDLQPFIQRLALVLNLLSLFAPLHTAMALSKVPLGGDRIAVLSVGVRTWNPWWSSKLESIEHPSLRSLRCQRTNISNTGYSQSWPSLPGWTSQLFKLVDGSWRLGPHG